VAEVINDDALEHRVERLELETQKAHELLQECRKRRLDLKGEIRSFVKVLKNLEVSVPKLQMEIEGFETTRQELTNLIPTLRVQSNISAEDEAKREELKEKIRQCKTEMDSCAAIADTLERELSKLQQDILDAGGTKLKNQKALCEKIMSDLDKLGNQLNASRVEISTAEKAESKASGTKQELEKKLVECEKALEQKEIEFKSLESAALEVMTAYEKVKALEAEKRASLDLASKDADGLKKAQSEARCREIDLLGQLEALEKQIADNRKKKQHWEKEITRLREVDSQFDFDEDSGDQTEEMEENVERNGIENEVSEGSSGSNSVSKIESPALLSHSFLQRYDTDEIKQAIATLESERNLIAKNANMGAIAEYRKKEADYLSR